MKGQLYGIYIPAEADIESCSVRSKEKLTSLFESGVNYDGFAYPYFDSVLMSDAFERFGLPFGTHSLVWDADGRLDGTDAIPLDYDYRQITGFLSDGMYEPKENELLIGGFEHIVSGTVQPWAIREHSRKFCSFCEHIARMEGVTLKGLTGGYVVAEVDNASTLEKVCDIFNAKTSGVCIYRGLRNGAAELEEK